MDLPAIGLPVVKLQYCLRSFAEGRNPCFSPRASCSGSLIFIGTTGSGCARRHVSRDAANTTRAKYRSGRRITLSSYLGASPLHARGTATLWFIADFYGIGITINAVLIAKTCLAETAPGFGVETGHFPRTHISFRTSSSSGRSRIKRVVYTYDNLGVRLRRWKIAAIGQSMTHVCPMHEQSGGRSGSQ